MVNDEMLAAEALSIMNSRKITALCVFKKNKRKITGLISMHNILNANNLDKDEYLEKCMKKDNVMSDSDYNEIKKYSSCSQTTLRNSTKLLASQEIQL